jgi:high affinity Mn2+ porin
MKLFKVVVVLVLFVALSKGVKAQNIDSNQVQRFNFHVQNTICVQGDPAFPVKYSAPNSLYNKGEIDKTLTLNLYAGLRLWKGAEVYADFLMWQGFGLSSTFGIEAFPNGDAYKAGTHTPNFSLTHLFLRQTFNLGGKQEFLPDDELTLAGKKDISRLTFTIGRISPMDFCDNNTYAKDPHTQFMNWAGMGNLSWDYGEDQIGYTTGLAIELNQPKWSLRYGTFQMPANKNGFTADDQYLMFPRRGSDGPILQSWAMMLEFERRYKIKSHAGAIRLMPWIDEADFASYKVATAMLLANPPNLNADGQGAGISVPQAARAYRYKYGICLNIEQEITKNVGVFSRIGWNNGQCESWTFTDVDWTTSFGASISGKIWHRNNDNIGVMYVVSGASKANQNFLKAGGTDMLDGDGNLNYQPERVLETYYDFQVWKTIHITLDYQFVTNPAFNHDRGAVSIFGARLHWEINHRYNERNNGIHGR